MSGGRRCCESTDQIISTRFRVESRRKRALRACLSFTTEDLIAQLGSPTGYGFGAYYSYSHRLTCFLYV